MFSFAFLNKLVVSSDFRKVVKLIAVCPLTANVP